LRVARQLQLKIPAQPFDCAGTFCFTDLPESVKQLEGVGIVVEELHLARDDHRPEHRFPVHLFAS
jgi:hypothetical protein